MKHVLPLIWLRKKIVLRVYGVLSVCTVCLFFCGCKIYSFTGASVSPDIKTVSIESFINQSDNGNVFISQDLTEQIKDKFLSETNLKLVPNGGDLEFSGVITGWRISSQAPTANQTSAINRLSITVQVQCTNRIYPKESWNQTFTRYDDYDSSLSQADVEQQLTRSVNAQLAEDIFNKAFVNW
ncbi:MAG: hypothetical protein KatS3mg031_2150 [Chitinophagales bacterium]|nr:MAG: hypothetical protein KatS3mg031_2150 [Chitinophagales bacterium]